MAGSDSVVAVDIGGTHARFAVAQLTRGCRPRLGPVFTYRTADHPGLASAWAAFRRDSGEAPAAASIAIAAALGGATIAFANNPWVIHPATLAGELGVAHIRLLNDFEAVAHAVAWLEPRELLRLAGPEAIPQHGLATIVGLGTGLGVAQLLRLADGGYHVIATEGGHGDFAPLDSVEDQILGRLRARFTRLSDERVVSGPALAYLYEAIAAIGGQAIRPRSDAELWDAALDGSDPVAVMALERLVRSFGSVAGDLVLQHGANQLIITGGIANRMASRLSGPLFHGRFCAKGRYAARMETFPVHLSTHEQPGLLGAAAAYSHEAMS